MFICPFDLHWCDLSDCRAGVCKFAADVPLSHCETCGELMERRASYGLCRDCVASSATTKLEGG